ncbi:MAG: peptidylprolyl isomerase [Alphaproteobacteria bacterium]|nr:peptidylprolyl isomerase [Alphaproteobacteria bacterium]
MPQFAFGVIRSAPALCLAVMLLVGGAEKAYAQTLQRIIAVVNEDAVSLFDLRERIKMVIFSSNMQDSPKMRERLEPQVLRALIDEKLQKQAAKRYNIKVDGKEVDKALRMIEKQNGLPPGGLKIRLEEAGVRMSTLVDQIETTIAWSKLVNRRMTRNIVIGDNQIDEALARIRANLNKPSHLVSQIFLAFDGPDNAAKTLADANQLVTQIRNGAAFTSLARQFSQDAAARNGGDLGWVQQGELDQELDRALIDMRPGQISEPIRTSSGYHILLLRKRRTSQKPRADDTVVSLKQVFLPIEAGATPEEAANQRNLATTIAETLSGCDDLERAGKELGSTLSGDLGKLKIGELPSELRALVTGLAVGRASKPLPTEGGLRILMVCDRKEVKSKIPSRDQIRRNLIRRQADRKARRYLRELHQTAFLDIRG